MLEISLKEMLEAGCHFGHQTHRWNPKMAPYIYGERNGIYIINLEKSLPLIIDACQYIVKTVAEGGNIMFVGTKKAAQSIVQQAAISCKMPYVTFRWLGGTLTNFRTIRGGIERLKKIESMMADGTIDSLVKKEKMMLGKEKLKLERNLSGIKDMGRLPAALFVVDPKKEHIAVAEAVRLHIPVIGLVDTNCDPDLVDFPVPSNDDSVRAIALLSNWLAQAVNEGLSRRDERIMAQADKEASGDMDAKGMEEKNDGPVVARRKPRRKVEDTAETTEVPAADSALL